MMVLVAHCRAGFEPEAAMDVERIVHAARASAALDAPKGRAFVVAMLGRHDAAALVSTLERSAPIFARSMFAALGPFTLVEPSSPASTRRPDRVAALVPLVDGLVRALPDRLRAPYGELRIEMPDTNDGKALSTLCRALSSPLDSMLREHALLIDDARRPTLHVLFADGATAYLGASAPPWRSAWPMGVARFRMPRGAPSRSTLKLAEAFAHFAGDDGAQAIRAGMKAVDLGAAPGGWSWHLAQRGVRVTAVDNAALKGEAADDPLVTHVRADGFAFRPRRPVDWMVCDIVEQPSRIAALVARWIAHGDARRSIFNLKLPMRRRYDEVVRCETMMRETLSHAGVRYALAFRQLYHDREEVTGYCARRD